MDRILTYTIKPEQEGMQLLDFLRSKGFSRGILSSMKADKNAIQLNGERGFGKSVLQAGDSLHIHIPEADNTENILPVKMNLSILYEDEDVVVINKESGMVVHPAAGNPDGTIVNALLHHCGDLSGIGGVERPGIVHRLDKDTSGCLVIAKNDAAHQSLTAQFAARSTEKRYLAVVQGIPSQSSGFSKSCPSI